MVDVRDNGYVAQITARGGGDAGGGHAGTPWIGAEMALRFVDVMHRWAMAPGAVLPHGT
ncbi:hypothetical protein GCM10027597_02520 [Saccharopolyspora tripterygii]